MALDTKEKFSISNLFSSVSLTITILILLALASIIGTLLPYFPSKFANYQLYSSWWFISLLLLLCLNITICSIKKFPIIKKASQPATRILTSSEICKLSNNASLTAEQSGEQLHQIVQTIFRKHHFSVSASDDSAGSQTGFIAEKGRFSRFSFFVAHISLLLIFCGSLVGAIFGFKGILQLTEGETSDSIFLVASREMIKLPFSIKCEEFQLVHYPGTQRVKDYLSKLAVIVDGEIVLRKQIEVNDPLNYNGIKFYQSSYGQAAFNPETQEMFLRVKDPKSKELMQELSATMGQAYQVQGFDREITIEVTEFVPDFVIGEQGDVVSRSPQMNNPAAKLRLSEKGELLEEFWVFSKFPDIVMGERKSPFHFSIHFQDLPYYTGLQVAKDPGVPFIWVGGIMLSLGLFMVFFWSHHKYFIVFTTEDERTFTIYLGAKTNRNRLALEREFTTLVEKIKKEVAKNE